MSLNQSDFFDVLPYHPRPEPFESLTGYLIRLAQSNGLKSAKALGAICFPDRLPPQKALPRNCDFPPRTWGALPRVTILSEAELLATTFYYLVQKFDRSVTDKTMGQFLKDCLGDSLRYCPVCLQETAYYRLPWRFLTLKGCPEHRCHFLDRCGHCGRPIPFLIAPLTVGICPHCRGDLRCCRTDLLAEQVQRDALAHLQDLQFLLSPALSPLIGTEAVPSIGMRLAYWRLKKGLLAANIAPQLGYPHTIVYALEERSGNGARFCRYVQYAACLGVTLRQIFHTVLPAEVNDRNWREWSRAEPWREQRWVSKVQAAIQQLEAAGKPVCQTEICQLLGCGASTLRQFPQVRTIFEQLKANRKAQKQRGHPEETELLAQAQDAVEQLKAAGKQVSQRGLCRMLGLPLSILDRPSRVETLIKQAVAESNLARQQRWQQRQKSLASELINPEEGKLMTAVQQAIDQLKQSGRSVTIEGICHLIGRSSTTLRTYPHIDLILEQVIFEQAQARQRQASQREEELVQVIQGAIAQLEAEDRLVTQRAIIQITGLALSTLSNYSRIKEIFASLPQKQVVFRQKQRQHYEQQLVAQVQTAIQKLGRLKQPLLLGNIARQVGLSLPMLQQFPGVKEILGRLKAERQQNSIVRAQRRDTELAQQTQQMAEMLIQSGQPVTKRAISQLVGLSLATYRSYPKANEVLNQVVQQ